MPSRTWFYSFSLKVRTLMEVEIAEGGASCKLTEAYGKCWLIALESDGSDPAGVLKVVRKAENIAREKGYTSLACDSSNKKLIGAANRTGWDIVTVIMEKQL